MNPSTTPKKPVKQIRPQGPFYICIQGLFVSYRSMNRKGHNIKSMLVSHACVDLIRMIQDGEFDQHLFDMMSSREHDFVAMLLKRCSIKSPAFTSAYNATIQPIINRLNMLQGAQEIGDDNPGISQEIGQLLEQLYQKNVFSYQLFAHMRRALKADRT